MSLPFDATLKELVRRYPRDWLIGLNLQTDLPVRALQESVDMVDLRDSSTYWVILEEGLAKGKAEGLRAMLLEVGERRLGAPTAEVQASLAEIDDTSRLHRMGRCVLDIATWQELLDTP